MFHQKKKKITPLCPNTHARPTSKSSVNQRGRCTDEELSLLPDKLPMSAIIISDFSMYVEQYIYLGTIQ